MAHQHVVVNSQVTYADQTIHSVGTADLFEAFVEGISVYHKKPSDIRSLAPKTTLAHFSL